MRHTPVAKSVGRFQIKCFKQEDYLRMYNGGATNNLVNRRIGSEVHNMRMIIYIWISMTAHLTICFQMCTMEKEKRGLCPYHDKRNMLVDLSDGRPSTNTHAYG